MSSFPFSYLCYVKLSPRDVGQLRAWLNEDLGEVVVVVAGGDHVETHQDVKGQGENRKIPTTVDRCQGAGHNGAGHEKASHQKSAPHSTHIYKMTQVHLCSITPVCANVKITERQHK